MRAPGGGSTAENEDNYGLWLALVQQLRLCDACKWGADLTLRVRGNKQPQNNDLQRQMLLEFAAGL